MKVARTVHLVFPQKSCKSLSRFLNSAITLSVVFPHPPLFKLEQVIRCDEKRPRTPLAPSGHGPGDAAIGDVTPRLGDTSAV